MTSDPYRPPDARLEDPRREAMPRSLLAAVLLGFLAEAAIGVAVGVTAVAAGWQLFLDARAQMVLTVLGGLCSGWIAARYRRGTWLDTSLWLIAIDAVPTFAALGFSIATQASTPSPWSLARPIVHAAVTLAAGRLGLTRP